MEEIAKEYEGGVRHCYVLEDREELFRAQVERISDVPLKENLRRAVRHLTIESVDLGLFELGKILEQQLRCFLKEARDKGVYDVGAQDLKRLVNMIDCVERNGIVKEKHHLTFLRQERNERAHGEIPDIATRRRLMQLVPFLGGLFIDYVVFFHRRRELL